MNKKMLYCSCGCIVGREEFSHLDSKLMGFGFDGGSVYKHVYNDKAARDTEGRIIPLRYNKYMCKNCYLEENTEYKSWVATYTDDNGLTTKQMTVYGKTYTKAYLAASIKISGIIVDLKEGI